MQSNQWKDAAANWGRLEQRCHRVEEVLGRALARPESERRTFVARECEGDASLEDEVAALLNALTCGGASARVGPDGPRRDDPRRGPPEGPSAWEPFLSRLRSRGPVHTRYVPLEEIGRGGMGVVRKVYDKDLRRFVAMKVVRTSFGGDVSSSERDRRVGRFLEEAQVAGQLDHPGIVPVYDVGVTADGSVYFTMKLIEGQSLRAILGLLQRHDAKWTRARVLSTLLRAAEAVAFAHHRGVVHRDLKPDNVMVGRFGETYVVDWGLARVLRDERSEPADAAEPAGEPAAPTSDRRELAEPGSSLFTAEGEVAGTPYYMAPEQARGARLEIGAPTDVYAMGAILYEILAGRRPHESAAPERPIDVVGRVLGGPPAAIERVARDAPPELVAICEKAMSADPRDRFATMDAFAEDLRASLENRVVRAYRTGPVVELRKWFARNRRFAIALVALGATTFLAAAFIAGQQARSTRALEVERDKNDLTLLLGLENEFDGTWGLEPAHQPGMQSWLERARAVAGRRGRHVAQLARLEAIAAPDGETAAWRTRLREVLVRLDRLESDVAGGATIPSMQRKRHEVETLRARSIDAARDAWAVAIAEVRDPTVCPAYAGLAIVPQLGLVPLHRDRATGLWEFYDVRTGLRPEVDGDGRVAAGPETAVVFVLLPGGDVRFGSQRSDPAAPFYCKSANRDELNESGRTVRLEPFFIAKHEMTQGQWLRLAGRNPSEFHPDYGIESVRTTLAHPVENVSWPECETLLARLGWCLPAETQWEYAARAGTATPWWFGQRSDLLHEVNLFDRTAMQFEAPWGEPWEELVDGYVVHAPVDTFRANPFGLHHVHGNVFEWTRDAYVTEYDAPLADGDGARGVDGGLRVNRGGSFGYSADAARSAYRNASDGRRVSGHIGLRPARRLER